MTTVKAKTTFESFATLLDDLLKSMLLSIDEETAKSLPLKLGAIKGKPYLNVGPFWIKTNTGSYDIYVWDKLMGALSFRVKISIKDKDITYKYAEGFGPNNWMPVLAVTKPKEPSKKLKYAKPMNNWEISRFTDDDGEDCFAVVHYVGGKVHSITEDIFASSERARLFRDALNKSSCSFEFQGEKLVYDLGNMDPEL